MLASKLLIPSVKVSVSSRKLSLNLITKNFFLLKMTSNKNSQISFLLARLDKAEAKIRFLTTEVTNIRSDLNKLTSGDDSDEDVINSDDEYDAPSAKKLKADFAMNNGYVVVYTDGACPKNGMRGAKAGIGVWWENNHPLNVCKPTVSRHTNNAAEIQACTEACRIAAQNGVKKLLIKTDSEFVIKCMTQWMKKWKQNNWKTAAGKDVINKEDLLELDKCSKQLVDLKYEHVKGHAGILGNEEADKLAVRGAGMN